MEKKDKNAEKCLKLAKKVKTDSITFFSKQDYTSLGGNKEPELIAKVHDNLRTMVFGLNAPLRAIAMKSSADDREQVIELLKEITNYFHLIYKIKETDNLREFRLTEKVLSAEDKKFIEKKA